MGCSDKRKAIQFFEEKNRSRGGNQKLREGVFGIIDWDGGLGEVGKIVSV